MKRILSISFCLCFLTGCGLFYPPRHEVLITQQSYQANQENQTEQTEQGSKEEIPLVSIPPVNPGTNSIIVKETRYYTPSTQVVFGFFPGFYTGFYPRWGYYPYRRYHYWGGYPYRRHHFRPPPPHRGGHRPPPPPGGHRGHRPPPPR